MISVETVKLYRRFNGDAGLTSRCMGSQTPANIDADWALLDEIVQGLFLIARGAASQEYKLETLAKIDEADCSLDARHVINEIVKSRVAALPPTS